MKLAKSSEKKIELLVKLIAFACEELTTCKYNLSIIEVVKVNNIPQKKNRDNPISKINIKLYEENDVS